MQRVDSLNNSTQQLSLLLYCSPVHTRRASWPRSAPPKSFPPVPNRVWSTPRCAEWRLRLPINGLWDPRHHHRPGWCCLLHGLRHTYTQQLKNFEQTRITTIRSVPTTTMVAKTRQRRPRRFHGSRPSLQLALHGKNINTAVYIFPCPRLQFLRLSDPHRHLQSPRIAVLSPDATTCTSSQRRPRTRKAPQTRYEHERRHRPTPDDEALP